MNNSYNNNNHSTISDLLSWIAVGLSLMFMLPLGLILLVNKLNKSFAKNRTDNKYTKQDGWRQSWDSETSRWRQGWRAEQEKWRQDWRTDRWGRRVENFFNSFFNDNSDNSSTYTGYYQSYNGSDTTGQATPEGTQTEHGSEQNQIGLSRTEQKSGYTQGKYKAPKEPYNAHTHANSSTRETMDEIERHVQRTGKGLSIALALLGGALALGGIVLSALGISQYVVYGLSVSNLLVSILGIFCLLGGISCFIARGIALARMQRFNKYANVVGKNDVISISDIAQTLGTSAKKTRRTITLMINAGYFGSEAYIDSSLDCLVRSSQAAENARADKNEGQTDDTSENNGNYFVSTINELHMLCINTTDHTICTKIQRIEELTAKIFRTVEEHPEKKPQLRRFLNIYLPTTLKLLHSYETLEKQGITGENIQSAKQDIERVLDTLITGFEQQLDHLFMADMLDISSDIDVLENLMHQDGLTPESQIFKAAGGN